MTIEEQIAAVRHKPHDRNFRNLIARRNERIKRLLDGTAAKRIVERVEHRQSERTRSNGRDCMAGEQSESDKTRTGSVESDIPSYQRRFLATSKYLSEYKQANHNERRRFGFGPPISTASPWLGSGLDRPLQEQ